MTAVGADRAGGGRRAGRLIRMCDIYLHVGPVKTGSTYMQDLLWTNRDSLAEQGVLHPCEHDNEMWLAANDIQDGAFLPFDLPEAAGAWNRIRDRVVAFGGPSIALLTAAREWPNPDDVALVVMIGPAQLADVRGHWRSHLGEEHGHRVLRACGRMSPAAILPGCARTAPDAALWRTSRAHGCRPR
jgi:hypothetical protein